MLLTTHEVSKKYELSAQHIRLLMRKGVLKGRFAKLTETKSIWLVDGDSVRRYKATKPRPGRKPTPNRAK